MKGQVSRVLIITMLSGAAVYAGSVSFSGLFTKDDDVFQGQFNVGSSSAVTIHTTSYAIGGFDTVVTVFASNGDLVDFNDDGGCSLVTPDTNGLCLDSYLQLTLAGGLYYFVVSQ